MARAVWKYPLQAGRQTIAMPEDALVLTVGVQDHPGAGPSVSVWALVDPKEPLVEDRSFVVVATGEAFDDSGLAYVGTVLIHVGALVFHVFMEVTGE